MTFHGRLSEIPCEKHLVLIHKKQKIFLVHIIFLVYFGTFFFLRFTFIWVNISFYILMISKWIKAYVHCGFCYQLCMKLSVNSPREYKHNFVSTFLHFQIFKTIGNLVIDFSFNLKNIYKQLSIPSKLRYSFVKTRHIFWHVSISKRKGIVSNTIPIPAHSFALRGRRTIFLCSGDKVESYMDLNLIAVLLKKLIAKSRLFLTAVSLSKFCLHGLSKS